LKPLSSVLRIAFVIRALSSFGRVRKISTKIDVGGEVHEDWETALAVIAGLAVQVRWRFAVTINECRER
jgi:hypothetical protein